MGSFRKRIKKKVDCCRGDIKRALAQVAGMYESYPEEYREHRQALQVLMEGLTMCWELLEKFADIV